MHFVKFRPWNSSGTPIPWNSSSRVIEVGVNVGGEIATRWSCWTNVCAVQEGFTNVQIGAVSGDIPRTSTPPRGFLGEVLPKGLILVGWCSLIPLIHLLQRRDIPGRTLGHTLKRRFALWGTLLRLAFCLLEFFWHGAPISNCTLEFIPKQRGFLLLLQLSQRQLTLPWCGL